MKEKNILGLDLGGTNARVGLVRNQQLGQVSSIKINPKGSVDEVLDQICRLIDESKPEILDGIGIGVPSVTDRLQANQQIARAAQADDLFSAVRSIRTDLNHTLRQRIQVRAGLPLQKKNLALIKRHVLQRIIDNTL